MARCQSMTIFVFPVSLLVDRWSRKKAIAIMGIVWGIASAACAFTKNFFHMLWLRSVVGVGEAAGAVADELERRGLTLVDSTQYCCEALVEEGVLTPFDPPAFPADARPDVPLGRMGTADEVAAIVCFLLSPEADWITGQIISVDGGRSTLRTKG